MERIELVISDDVSIVLPSKARLTDLMEAWVALGTMIHGALIEEKPMMADDMMKEAVDRLIVSRVKSNRNDA